MVAQTWVIDIQYLFQAFRAPLTLDRPGSDSLKTSTEYLIQTPLQSRFTFNFFTFTPKLFPFHFGFRGTISDNLTLLHRGGQQRGARAVLGGLRGRHIEPMTTAGAPCKKLTVITGGWGNGRMMKRVPYYIYIHNCTTHECVTWDTYRSGSKHQQLPLTRALPLLNR